MVIREMGREECLALLAGSGMFRLACARDDQPYVVPVSLVFDAASACLYGHTTLGRKVEWMRTNPRVCVEADEITAQDHWMSVVAHGRYEEVPAPPAPPQGQTPGRAPERAELDGTPAALRPHAVPPMGNDASFQEVFEMLQKLPSWWQPGTAAWAARAHGGSTKPFVSIFYRIRLDAITGHAATP